MATPTPYSAGGAHARSSSGRAIDAADLLVGLKSYQSIYKRLLRLGRLRSDTRVIDIMSPSAIATRVLCNLVPQPGRIALLPSSRSLNTLRSEQVRCNIDVLDDPADLTREYRSKNLDVVVMADSIQCFDDKKAVLLELSDIVHDNGTMLMCTTHYEYSITNDPTRHAQQVMLDANKIAAYIGTRDAMITIRDASQERLTPLEFRSLMRTTGWYVVHSEEMSISLPQWCMSMIVTDRSVTSRDVSLSNLPMFPAVLRNQSRIDDPRQMWLEMHSIIIVARKSRNVC